MSRLDKKHCDKSEQSAANQEDLEFEAWLTQRVLDEAAEMIDELGEDPEMNNHNLEPTEEGFQQFLKMARTEGLVEEEEKDRKETKEESETISEMLRVADEADKGRPARDEKVVRYSRLRHNALKWVAFVAVTLLGVFGVSMSSEANRVYLMEKVDETFNGDKDTTFNNTEEILNEGDAELSAREKIEEILKIEMPTFYYMPDNLEYVSFSIDENAHVAYIEYVYNNESAVQLIILANYRDAAGMSRNDQGSKVEEIKSDLSDVKSELWMVRKDDDIKDTFIGQWTYKNTFYEIIGKMDKNDIQKMLENVLYE